MEDYEALTEAELEYERKRKAAARRRKLAAREARRRKRRRQAIIRCSILLLIVILLITGIVKMITGIWKHFHKDKSPAKKTEQMNNPTTEQVRTEAPAPEIEESILAKELPADRTAALELLKTQGETDREIQNIYENASIYPDALLQNLAINHEMKQFVINYPAKIRIVFDGNFNMDVPSDEVPLFLQFDEQWGYADYGNNIIGLNGCGPTCLSMAYTYLMQDGSMNPIKAADYSMEHGYLDGNGDTMWTLMTKGATELGLTSEELTLSKQNMTTALKEGKVIICSMSSGDFTKNGHFILIREYKNGLFYVNDPNSEARSQPGWDYDRLSQQIANMWALGKGNASAPDSQTDSLDASLTSGQTDSPTTTSPVSEQSDEH